MKSSILRLILIIGITAAPVYSQESTVQTKDAHPRVLFSIEQNGKMGFIDNTGSVVIPPQFKGSIYSTFFSEGLTPVVISDKWGYIDRTGRVVIRPAFYQAGPFSGGLAPIAVMRKGPDQESQRSDVKYGYIDKTGRVVIKPQFDETYGFSEGLARVVVNEKWGFIDKTGKIVIEPQFYSARGFRDGFASVELDNRQTVYIDKWGMVNDLQYEYTDAGFSEGLMPVKKGLKWGYISKDWKIVIEPQFDTAQSFSEGLAAVSVGGKYGFIDVTGRMVIALQFTNQPSHFSEGLAAVSVEGRYGFIDVTGKMVIAPQFANQPSDFSEGLAVLRVDGKYGYINRNGEIVIEPIFEAAQDFRGGLAAVTTSKNIHYASCCWNRWEYIDKAGRYVWRAAK